MYMYNRSVHGGQKCFQQWDFTLVQIYPKIMKQPRTQAFSGREKERQSLVHTNLHMHVIIPNFWGSNISGHFPFMSEHHDVTRSSLHSLAEPCLLTFNVYICKYYSARPNICMRQQIRFHEPLQQIKLGEMLQQIRLGLPLQQIYMQCVACAYMQQHIHVHVSLLTVNVRHHEYNQLMLAQFNPAHFSPHSLLAIITRMCKLVCTRLFLSSPHPL